MAETCHWRLLIANDFHNFYVSRNVAISAVLPL